MMPRSQEIGKSGHRANKYDAPAVQKHLPEGIVKHRGNQNRGKKRRANERRPQLLLRFVQWFCVCQMQENRDIQKPRN